MKKILIAICLVASACFCASCIRYDTNIEAGGTAVAKMAGFWDVTLYICDVNGEIVDDEPWTETSLLTYNTSDNSTEQMWIEYIDDGWRDFKFKVDICYPDRTFLTKGGWRPYYAEVAEDDDEPGNAVIYGGKVLEGQGHNVHGNPCDSIAFILKFDDDPYPAAYGYDHYLVTGIRYGGYESKE